jgi:hypothetical protein
MVSHSRAVIHGRRKGGAPGISDVDETKWREIMPVMAEIIAHCPLKIGPQKKFASILDAIRLRPLKGKSVVEQLMVIKVPSSTFYPEAPVNEITYCIALTTTDTATIVVPLVRA